MPAGEGYLKNLQKALNKRHQHQPETSYLSPHPAGCGRRVSITLLPKATHLDIALAMTLWILRHGTSSREYRRRMTLIVEAEKALNQHLCNNKANLLTRLGTRCKKILGTGPRMTGARDVGLVPPAGLLLPLTRSDAPTSPSRGEVVGLLLCLLFTNMSIFLPNPAKTC